jgi:hypothetical protein
MNLFKILLNDMMTGKTGRIDHQKTELLATRQIIKYTFIKSLTQNVIFKILINVQIPVWGGQSISVWGVFKIGEGWSI